MALAQFPLWLRPKFQITPQLVPRISCLRGESTRYSVDSSIVPRGKSLPLGRIRGGLPKFNCLTESECPPPGSPYSRVAIEEHSHDKI